MLDKAVARLKGSTTLEDRLEILQYLVQYWHGTISAEDGMTEDELRGLQLPRPLLWWYRWAGNRPEIMSGQNFLFSPRETLYDYRKLRVVNDHLFFHIENQGAYQWATLPEGDDPPVFGRRDDSDPWQREDVSLSEHLILTCLFEAILCHASYTASKAWLTEDQLNRITNTVPVLAIAAWQWPGETRFHVGGGAFMCVAKHKVRAETGYSIWIGARARQDLQFLVPYVDESWEHAEL